MTEQSHDIIKIAVYDQGTGLIDRTINCRRDHMEAVLTGLQEYATVEVEDTCHPNHHMICPKTHKPIPRVAPHHERVRNKLQELDSAYTQSQESFISGGLQYRSLPEDREDLMLAAQVGGDVFLADGSLKTLSAEEGRQVLKDWGTHKTLAKRRLVYHKSRAATDPTAVKWDDKTPEEANNDSEDRKDGKTRGPDHSAQGPATGAG